MSYDFKKLSDVDVVDSPSDTANVLIEEGGVIKKAPKTAIGGVGGDEYDMVIHAMLGDSWSKVNNIDASDYVISSGTYNDLKSKMNQDSMLKVLMRYQISYAGCNEYITFKFVDFHFIEASSDGNECIAMSYVGVDGSGQLFALTLVLRPDNSIEVFWPLNASAQS